MITDRLAPHRARTNNFQADTVPTGRYEVMAQTSSGAIRTVARNAPVAAPFLSDFASIARGAILETSNGSKAVEDIEPGDRVMTGSGRVELVLWRGSVTLDPSLPGADFRLLRVPTDAFGPARPATDTIFGPAAMRVHRTADYCAPLSATAVMTPLSEHADGMSLIQIRPRAPVQFFQIGFSRQQGLQVGGNEVASLCAGMSDLNRLTPSLRAAYLTLFPQHAHIEAAARPMGPHLNREQMDRLAA